MLNKEIKENFGIFEHKNDTVIIRGDCKDVMDIYGYEDITLAFTSPPYFNAINYSGHIEKIKGNKDRWEREDVNYKEYKQFLIERFQALYKIIQPGGYNIVNISPVAWKNKRVALPFHFECWMEEIGWEFKEDIVWEKTVARDRRSGVLLQHPYPGYYYPSLVSEYIFVFQKPAGKKKKQNIYWYRSKEEKEKNRLNLDEFNGGSSKNVWRIRPLSPQENIHPCPFPLELAKRIISFYSYKGDKVIDIFSGSGQTLLAAKELERKSIGIETQQEYIDYNLQRLKKNFKQMTFERLKNGR